MRFGGRSATPCEAIVRRRSTGSPPAPTSRNSVRAGTSFFHFQRPQRPSTSGGSREMIGAVKVLGVDVGGTFTDAVLVDDGRLTTAKIPTAARQDESVVAAARALGPEQVERFTHGTTVATNALLERKGARTAFVTTAGFEHLLHVRRQDRAHLYRLCESHAEPLVPLERSFGVEERIGHEGV